MGLYGDIGKMCLVIYVASLSQVTVSQGIGACTIVDISILHFCSVLDPNLLLEWVSLYVSLGLKWLGHEADLCSAIPTCVFVACHHLDCC
jgi:hypothetical protein